MSNNPNQNNNPTPLPENYYDKQRREFMRVALPLGLGAAVAFGAIIEYMYQEAASTGSPNAAPTPNALMQELIQDRSTISNRIAAIMNDKQINGRRLDIPDRQPNAHLPGEAIVITAKTTDPNRPFGAYRLDQYTAAGDRRQPVVVGVTEYAQAGDNDGFTNNDIIRQFVIAGEADGSLTMATMEHVTVDGVSYMYGTMISSADPSRMHVSRQPPSTSKVPSQLWTMQVPPGYVENRYQEALATITQCSQHPPDPVRTNSAPYPLPTPSSVPS